MNDYAQQESSLVVMCHADTNAICGYEWPFHSRNTFQVSYTQIMLFACVSGTGGCVLVLLVVKKKRKKKETCCLKGKFSSGIEGALASTLNHDFNWKQLSEIILRIFLLMFSKFIWVTLIQEQQKYIKRDFEFWAWASHFIMIWNITIRYQFLRTYLFQHA